VSFVFQKKNLPQKAQLSAAFSPAPLRGDNGRILGKMVGTDFCAFCFFKKDIIKRQNSQIRLSFAFVPFVFQKKDCHKGYNSQLTFHFCAFCVSKKEFTTKGTT
jgi:hypothetical protein